MWTWIFDSASGNLCRHLNAVVGHFPAACLISAGRPALYAAAALVLVLLTASIVGWQRYRGSKLS